MATSKGDLEDADNLLEDDLKSGKSVTIDFDLESTKKWYISAVFDSGSDLEEKTLTFSYSDPGSATIDIKSASSVSISKEKKNGSSSDGDITLAIINNSGEDIIEAYLVDDEEDWSGSSDRNDDDDLLGGKELDDGDYVVISEACSNDSYDLLLYYADGNSKYEKFSIDLEDASNYASIYV